MAPRFVIHHSARWSIYWSVQHPPVFIGQGGEGVRFRLGKGGHPPHKVFGYGLIGAGGLIMLLAMPFFFWVAVIGCLICYFGYCVLQNRL